MKRNVFLCQWNKKGPDFPKKGEFWPNNPIMPNSIDYNQEVKSPESGAWMKCHIETDSSVTTIIHPTRCVPYALLDSLKSELDSLVDKGIKGPVTQPTDWVNSYVCVTER